MFYLSGCHSHSRRYVFTSRILQILPSYLVPRVLKPTRTLVQNFSSSIKKKMYFSPHFDVLWCLAADVSTITTSTTSTRRNYKNSLLHFDFREKHLPCLHPSYFSSFVPSRKSSSITWKTWCKTTFTMYRTFQQLFSFFFDDFFPILYSRYGYICICFSFPFLLFTFSFLLLNQEDSHLSLSLSFELRSSRTLQNFLFPEPFVVRKVSRKCFFSNHLLKWNEERTIQELLFESRTRAE